MTNSLRIKVICETATLRLNCDKSVTALVSMSYNDAASCLAGSLTIEVPEGRSFEVGKEYYLELTEVDSQS